MRIGELFDIFGIGLMAIPIPSLLWVIFRKSDNPFMNRLAKVAGWISIGAIVMTAFGLVGIMVFAG